MDFPYEMFVKTSATPRGGRTRKTAYLRVRGSVDLPSVSLRPTVSYAASDDLADRTDFFRDDAGRWYRELGRIDGESLSYRGNLATVLSDPYERAKRNYLGFGNARDRRSVYPVQPEQGHGFALAVAEVGDVDLEEAEAEDIRRQMMTTERELSNLSVFDGRAFVEAEEPVLVLRLHRGTKDVFDLAVADRPSAIGPGSINFHVNIACFRLDEKMEALELAHALHPRPPWAGLRGKLTLLDNEHSADADAITLRLTAGRMYATYAERANETSASEFARRCDPGSIPLFQRLGTALLEESSGAIESAIEAIIERSGPSAPDFWPDILDGYTPGAMLDRYRARSITLPGLT